MSAINGLGGDRPAKRTRMDPEKSQSSVDVLTGLENELRDLPDGHYNYDLVRRVEAFRTHHLPSPSPSSFFVKTPGSFFTATSMRVERLYREILIKHFLNENWKDDSPSLVSNMNDSIIRNDIPRVAFLAPYLDSIRRGFFVMNGARFNQEHIVNTLLLSGPISEADRGMAVIEAARGGHLNVIQALLAHGASISEEGRRMAVIEAAQGGHLNVIQALLAVGDGGDAISKFFDDIVLDLFS